MSADTNSLLERLPLLHGRVIDYGQKASPSKARHEHSVIGEWRRVLYCRAGCWCQQGHSNHLLYSFAPRQSQTMLQFWWESSIQDLSTMNGKHTSKGGDMKSLQSRPTSVRMELNAPFSQEWAFCIDDTSLLSPLAARWFGIIPPSTVVTDFLSGNTMTFFLDYSVPPCRQ